MKKFILFLFVSLTLLSVTGFVNGPNEKAIQSNIELVVTDCFSHQIIDGVEKINFNEKTVLVSNFKKENISSLNAGYVFHLIDYENIS